MTVPMSLLLTSFANVRGARISWGFDMLCDLNRATTRELEANRPGASDFPTAVIDASHNRCASVRGTRRLIAARCRQDAQAEN